MPFSQSTALCVSITGGEEDGVNNEHVDPEKLYTTPEQVL
jgi:fructose-bisphosphate aldolase class II